MQSRRDWLKASMGIGGLMLAPSTLLTAQEKENFQPRSLELIIRLSSNENPYGPSKRVRERIKNSFEHACRYPYAYSDDLAEQLAKKHGVSPESIIVTGGSTEGLKVAGITFAANGGEIISGQPTFLAMMNYAEHWGATVKWVPVGEDKGYDLDAIEKQISSKTKLVFLCNPNNPTGTLVPAQKLVPGVVTHDCDNGHIFYHTSISANFTANFTNLGLSSNYSTNLVLILDQGSTAYIPSAVQIGGSGQTINWQGGSAPTGTVNGIDAVSFTVLEVSGTYVVLGQLVDFA